MSLVAAAHTCPHIQFSMENSSHGNRLPDLQVDCIYRGHQCRLAGLENQQQPRSHSKSPDLETSSETRIALLKKLQHEKATRHLKLRQIDEKRRQQFAAEEEKARQIALTDREMQRAETLSKLAKQREILLKRQTDRKLIKAQTEEALAQIKHRSYLYQKLDEDSKVQARALARSQEEALSQRRRSIQGAVDFSSISLLRHERELGTHSIEREISRRERSKSQERRFRQWRTELRALAPNKQVQRWDEELQLSKQAVLLRAKSAHLLYEKKQRYAELVRELFPPKRRLQPVPVAASPPRKVQVFYPVLRRQRKQWTPQPSRRTATVSPLPERKDYLTPLRLQREHSFRSNPRMSSRLQHSSVLFNPRLPLTQRVRKAQCERADSAAKAQEIMLNRMERDWSFGVEARQVAADLYVTSIRAKLDLLAQL